MSTAGGPEAREHAPLPAPADPSAAGPETLGARLLGADESTSAPSIARELARFAGGLGLASLYGLAIGAREGGRALLDNALGAPSAMLAVGALGVPSFAIVLALMNAPVDGLRLAAVTSRATATTGLVLAGLAPAAALFAVTSSTHEAAAWTALLGLLVGGALGLGRLLVGLRRALSGADSATRLLGTVASGGFGMFAIALAARLWATALPALTLTGGAP
jgi:hypothetical protein